MVGVPEYLSQSSKCYSEIKRQIQAFIVVLPLTLTGREHEGRRQRMIC